MALAKIKKEFSSTFIAFGEGGSKTLGQRDDIDLLAIMAHESQNPNLIKLFEVLPPLEELKRAVVDNTLKKTAAEIKAADTSKVDSK